MGFLGDVGGFFKDLGNRTVKIVKGAYHIGENVVNRAAHIVEKGADAGEKIIDGVGSIASNSWFLPVAIVAGLGIGAYVYVNMKKSE